MASNVILQAARKSSAMGPSVRNLLAHYKLDPSQIVSTGPHRTLLKSDVLSFIDQKNLLPGQGNGFTSKQHNLAATVTKSSLTPNAARLGTRAIVYHSPNEANVRHKYARKDLTQLEIDVINNGGRL